MQKIHFKKNPFASNPFGDVPPVNYPQKQKSNGGIIVGVVLIVIGAAVLVDEYDLIPDFDFGRLWPVILVLVGASLIVSGQKKQLWHSDNWHKDAAATDATADSAPKTESSEQQEPLV